MVLQWLKKYRARKAASKEPKELTPAQKCLFMEDIYESIVREVYDGGNDKGSLVSLAVTCKALYPGAVALVWQDLDSFRPLLALLPHHVLTRARAGRPDGGILFELRRTTKRHRLDLHRLEYYSQYIRRFSVKMLGNSNLKLGTMEYFLGLVQGLRLFRNVRSFTWVGIPPGAIMSTLIQANAFVNPRLEELRLSISRADDICRVLGQVRETCRNLRVLVLSGSSPSTAPDVREQLAALLQQSSLLEFRSRFPLTAEDLLALAAMPHLKTAAIALEPGVLNHSTTTHLLRSSRCFPALETFEVSLDELSSSSPMLLCSIRSARLSKIALHVSCQPADGSILAENLEAIAISPYKDRLRHLDLKFGSSYSSEMISPCDITLETLRPLLTVKGLTTVSIRAHSLKLDADALRRIALGIPQIQKLWILPESRTPDYSPVPLQALFPFAEHCPKLKSLGFYVDNGDTARIKELPQGWQSRSEVVRLNLVFPETDFTLNPRPRYRGYLAKVFPRNTLTGPFDVRDGDVDEDYAPESQFSGMIRFPFAPGEEPETDFDRSNDGEPAVNGQNYDYLLL